MIKQIREDTGNVYWEMWDDEGRLATITKEGRNKYVGKFERYTLTHRTKKRVINHIKTIIKLRADSINKNEHALQGVQ